MELQEAKMVTLTEASMSLNVEATEQSGLLQSETEVKMLYICNLCYNHNPHFDNSVAERMPSVFKPALCCITGVGWV